MISKLINSNNLLFLIQCISVIRNVLHNAAIQSSELVIFVIPQPPLKYELPGDRVLIHV